MKNSIATLILVLLGYALWLGVSAFQYIEKDGIECLFRLLQAQFLNLGGAIALWQWRKLYPKREESE